MKLSKRRGLQLEAFGSVLIITVMLTDRFLFSVQNGFILICAIISAAALILGIRTVKRFDAGSEKEETPSAGRGSGRRGVL
jgi:hypothetical protein